MLSIFGNITLISITLLAGLISVPSIVVRRLVLSKAIAPIFFVIIGLIIGAIALLEYAFIVTDLSLELVYLNSHKSKPLIFKISGLWANHEGSMLLWLLVLGLSGAVFLLISKSSQPMQKWVLAIQSLSIMAFALYILITSNPFIANILQPEAGLGLNPILQDIGLLFHPPSLYFGYVGFSIAYSICVGMCMHGKYDVSVVRDLKIWTLFSWSILTFGILLGSLWSYRELGWGGYWFWDPVENASVIPWLIGNSLLHSIFLYQKRGINFKFMITSAILTYCAAIVGTFIVRSGMINSVHTFASDPMRGFILLLIGVSLLIFGLIAASMAKTKNTTLKFGRLSKESLLLFNNILMLSTAAIIAFATLYPLVADLFFHQKLVIGEAYFNIVLLPIAMLTIVGSIIALDTKWGQDSWQRLKCSLKFEMISATIGLYLFLILPKLVAFAAIIIIIYIVHIARKYIQKVGYNQLCSEFMHFGFALLFFAVVANSAFQTDASYKMKIGETIDFDNKTLTLDDIRFFQKDNYLVRQAVINFGGQMAYPENRIYIAEDASAHQSYQLKAFVSDYYFSIHAAPQMESDEIIVTIVLKSFVNLIWIAGYLMVLAAMAKSLLYLTSRVVSPKG